MRPELDLQQVEGHSAQIGWNLGVGNLEGYDQEHPRLAMAARLIPVLAALALGLALGCVGVSPVQVPVPTPNPVPGPRLPPTSACALDILGAASGVGQLPDRSVRGHASTPPAAPDWNTGPETPDWRTLQSHPSAVSRNIRAKSFDFGGDRFGSCDPGEGTGLGIARLHEGVDLAGQFLNAGERAAGDGSPTSRIGRESKDVLREVGYLPLLSIRP